MTYKLWTAAPSFLRLSLPVRMTVIRLRSGRLWLHSRNKPIDALRAELDRLRAPRETVAPNSAHWISVKDWQQLYPHAVTWAAPHLPAS